MIQHQYKPRVYRCTHFEKGIAPVLQHRGLSRQIPICQSNVHGSVDCDLHIGTQKCKEGYCMATWSGQQARWHLNSLRFPYVQLAIVDTIHKGVPMWDRVFLNLSTRNRGRKQSAIECWFIKVCQPWGEVPLARELEPICRFSPVTSREIDSQNRLVIRTLLMLVIEGGCQVGFSL